MCELCVAVSVSVEVSFIDFVDQVGGGKCSEVSLVSCCWVAMHYIHSGFGSTLLLTGNCLWAGPKFFFIFAKFCFK